MVATRPRVTSARPSWLALCAREPRLLDLLEEIRALPTADPHYCAIGAWFGTPRTDDGIKARMVRLVGWHAARPDAVLRTDRAYRAAYRVLYDAVPPCRDCLCRSIQRAIFGAEATP